MPVSDYSRGEIAEWMGGISSMPATGTRYLALYDDNGDEVTGGSYARKACDFDTTGTPGVVETAAAITFANMPAVTAESAALHDAVSSGNRLTAITAVSTPKTFTAGMSAVVEAGDCTFTQT